MIVLASAIQQKIYSPLYPMPSESGIRRKVIPFYSAATKIIEIGEKMYILTIHQPCLIHPAHPIPSSGIDPGFMSSSPDTE
jgi:hypothetical protein